MLKNRERDKGKEKNVNKKNPIDSIDINSIIGEVLAPMVKAVGH